MPGEKAIRGGDLVGVHLEILRLDVYENELPLVLTLHTPTHDTLVDFVPAPGEFLFAITWLDSRHDFLRYTLHRPPLYRRP